MFVIEKRIDLSKLGTGWENCFISFSPFSFGENKQLVLMRKDMLAGQEDDKTSEQMLDLLKKHLIAGKGFDGKGEVDITADNLEDLPIEIIIELMQELQVGKALDPKA